MAFKFSSSSSCTSRIRPRTRMFRHKSIQKQVKLSLLMLSSICYRWSHAWTQSRCSAFQLWHRCLRLRSAKTRWTNLNCSVKALAIELSRCEAASTSSEKTSSRRRSLKWRHACRAASSDHNLMTKCNLSRRSSDLVSSRRLVRQRTSSIPTMREGEEPLSASMVPIGRVCSQSMKPLQALMS